MNQSVVICLVDDDEVYQFCMRKIIEKLNAEQIKKILAFTDGEEAIDFMSENASNNSELPNIILLDINMPIMDGWQFMEEYVKLKPRLGKNIIIYMVSSSKNAEDIERAKRISEISDYLVKPVTPEELQLILNALPLQLAV